MDQYESIWPHKIHVSARQPHAYSRRGPTRGRCEGLWDSRAGPSVVGLTLLFWPLLSEADLGFLPHSLASFMRFWFRHGHLTWTFRVLVFELLHRLPPCSSQPPWTVGQVYWVGRWLNLNVFCRCSSWLSLKFDCGHVSTRAGPDIFK